MTSMSITSSIDQGTDHHTVLLTTQTLFIRGGSTQVLVRLLQRAFLILSAQDIPLAKRGTTGLESNFPIFSGIDSYQFQGRALWRQKNPTFPPL